MSARASAACVLGAALLIVGPPTALAQLLSPEARWAQAVRAHEPGQADEALQTVAAWTEAETLAGLRPVPAPTAFLHRALILHTDIAIVERAAFDRNLPPAFAGKVLLLDPTRRDAVARAFQWRIARTIAGRLAAHADGVQTVRLWYRATSGMLQQWSDSATLRPHLQAGLERFPDDPQLLLVAGTLHQTFADARIRAYLDRMDLAEESTRSPRLGANVAGMRTPGVGLSDRVDGGRRRSTAVAARVGATSEQGELERAEEALRRALAGDATLVEARVRLAHVLVRRQRPADAIATLDPLRGVALSPVLEYYQAMVLGAGLDALDRHREAFVAFERAAALLPGAQSARVAISRQTLVDGHVSDGLQALVDGLGPDALRAAPARDPWYDYFRFHEPDAGTLVAGFRTIAQ